MVDLFDESERFDPRDHILLLEFPLTSEQSKSLESYLCAQKSLDVAYMFACGVGVSMFSDAENLSADIARRLNLMDNSLEYQVARIGFDNARKAFYDTLRADLRYVDNKILARSA